MRRLPPFFCAEFFSIFLNRQAFGETPLMGDRSVLMHHSVFKPQLSATCSVLNFMHSFELDLDIRCRKMALSVGVYFLANAEEHFV